MQRYQILTQNEIEQIHETSLRIMENVGIVMTYEPAKEVLKKAGAAIDKDIVRFPRSLVEASIKSCPSSFTMHARNPEKNVEISCEKTVYAGPNTPPFVTDLDHGRRSGTLQDHINFVKIVDKLEHIDIQSEAPCEPSDIEVDKRSNLMLYNIFKYSDKPMMGGCLGYKASMENIEMASIVFGGLDAIREKPVICAIPCSLTPLSYDDKMLGALMAYAETRQPQLINSLGIAGMTAPATLAGLVAVSNAEILAGIVLAQAISPQTPVIYAASGSNAEMSNGALSTGSPEDALVALMIGQLCKYYQIPCRNSGALTDSKTLDTQLAYESAITLSMAQMSGGNFILHGAGIMESYNCVSYEKLIIDHEILGIMKRIGRGVTVNEDTLAYDVIEEVGPKGSFLIEEHTVEHFRSEFYRPTLSDRLTHVQWVEKGSLTSEQRANIKWKEILANYGESTLDAETDRALKRYLEAH